MVKLLSFLIYDEIPVDRPTEGWISQAVFSIQLHIKDKAVLESIQTFFLIDTIYNIGDNKVHYRVLVIGELAFIIAHFDKYPLKPQKFVCGFFII